MNEITSPAAPALDTANRLAVDRTRLAYERTMMAWVRTGLSLISFGFTIYKLFEYQVELGAKGGGFLSPRVFAVLMIGTGLVSLVLAGIEHRQSMRSLRATYGPQPRSVAGLVGGIVALIGLGAFVTVLVGG
jgi:putative membrane protein